MSGGDSISPEAGIGSEGEGACVRERGCVGKIGDIIFDSLETSGTVGAKWSYK